jgi:GT2 family glycosyltransferase
VAPAAVTAIIVNYNGLPFVREAVQSLLDQTTPPEQLILVDNGSTDGSVAFLRELFPSLQILEAGRNLGFTGGNNLGAAHARGELLALLNSDAVADARWLETLSATLERNPQAGAAVGKILMAERPGHIDQAGALFNNLGNYWGRGYTEPDEGQFEEECEVAGITCCAGMVRKAALEREPLFDESIFMYGEELDLTIRLRSAGWSILYTPHAVVRHGGMKSVQATQASPRLFQQRLANRNRLKLLMKYYPASIVVTSSPLVLMGMAYWTAVFIRHAGWRAAWAFVADLALGIRRGLRERDARMLRSSERWRPWMTRHTLGGVLRQLRTMRRAD